MRTQADRDFDLQSGRDIERKDAELSEMRSELAGALAREETLRNERDAAITMIGRLRAALKLGRQCVIESFDYVKSTDDQYLADARLRDIDAALASAGQI